MLGLFVFFFQFTIHYNFILFKPECLFLVYLYCSILFELLCISLALQDSSPLLQCHLITAHCFCATLREAMTQGNNTHDIYHLVQYLLEQALL